MQTRTLTTARGDRVTYDAHGPVGEAGEAAAVVFVAGAGPFRAADPATTACASALADRGVPALVHDRLGRGDSTVDGRIDLDREVAAIGALVGAAGGRVVLCGHSSGGAIALHAVTHGVPAGAVVCFEAPLDPSTPGVGAWTLEVERLLDAGDDEAALDHYLRDLPAELVGGLRSSPFWPAWVVHAPALRPDAQALRWAFAAPYDEGFGRELGARRVPVVAVHGTATFPEMPVAARAVAEAVPGGRVVEVPGENHTWEPASMADLLAEVARSVPER